MHLAGVVPQRIDLYTTDFISVHLCLDTLFDNA